MEYEEMRIRNREAVKRWREKPGNRERANARTAAWGAANREKRTDQAKARNRATRLRCIAFMGGECIRCGFSDPRALQIDHIEGGGMKEWAAIGGLGIVKRVLAGAPGYQLLCANCNWIKRHENDEVPGYHRGVG
jgi:hypothetical protein